MKRTLTFLLPLLLLCFTIQAQEAITITDDDLQANTVHNWTNNNTYLLDGFVFLEEGGILNIEAGTVIKSKEIPSTSDNATALIIARGATINAIGTADQPIIFTTELDDTNDDFDLFAEDRGFWGGLVVLGYGQLANTTKETRIEGIPDGETRALFGGDNDADNSGTIKYVSIRHGGAELSPGDEINGLTLGAVGSGTTIEHIEVIANQDDGIEFFGGAVNVKYASVSFAGDDAFDWDLGWRGKGQFWFALLGEDDGDNGGELDGAKPDDGSPTSNPTIANATFIGAGCTANAKNETALLFRDGSAGKIYNSIFTGFNNGVEVEDRASGVDSRLRMEEGDLVLAGNIWFGMCDGDAFAPQRSLRITDDAEDGNGQFLINHLEANKNTTENPNLNSISRTDDEGLDPRPAVEGVAFQDIATSVELDNDFFETTTYKGAFDAAGNPFWLRNWTALSTYGFLPKLTTSTETIEIQAKGYTLIQNSPNPTATVTQIGFNLPTKSTISLTVYDYTGKAVKNLIDNERYLAGKNTIELEVSALESGVYFYTLQTEDVVLTKQLVVL